MSGVIHHKRTRSHEKNGKRAGFSLLEISIVLAIIAIFLGGAMLAFSTSLQNRSLQETQNKLHAIQQALYNYRVAYGRLPCPGDGTKAPNDQYFGVEASLHGDCYTSGTVKANFQSTTAGGGSSTDPNCQCIGSGGVHSLWINVPAGDLAPTVGTTISGNIVTSGDIPAGSTLTAVTYGTTNNGYDIYYTTIDNTVIQAHDLQNCTITIPSTSVGVDAEGMVPTKTLQLPDDYAFDGWGRRIMYVVALSYTGDSSSDGHTAFQSIPASSTVTRMTICDATGYNTGSSSCNNAKTTQAAYVLISFGANGHGAYSRYGSTRINSGSTNTDEHTNCDCSSTATAVGTPPAGVFVQKNATQDPATPARTNDFDDIVVFGTRSDLRTLNE